jgi:signal transduction histidine kinase
VPIRIFHTEGFRIAAIFVAIFALSVAILAVVTLAVVDQELRGQIVQFAAADIGSVKDGYRTEGEDEAREVIGQRLATPGASDFFLLQRGASTKLAGNMPPMAPRTGTFTLPYPGGAAGRTILGVGAFIAPDLYVFSGSDLRSAQMARQRILRTLIWVSAGALALALLGGVIVSRSFLRRADEIATTCRAIMAGNLASRIPVRGTEDELDRLSETINAMLDRIAALMDNLKQITNDIAHDLRTPVTHLRHRLERARDQSGSVEDYDQALEAAIGASDDILALFSALLRIAQIEGGARRAAFAPLDLSSLLAQLGDVFGPVAEDARHHLSLSLNGPAVISGDRELLTQAFSNLIENAILHTPAGTIVTISLCRENNDAVVTVSDDGPGVPPGEHQKLFQRFYRLEASRTRPGYGLGLALVAAIGELHEARTTIHQTDGKGFSISLRLPLVSQIS